MHSANTAALFSHKTETDKANNTFKGVRNISVLPDVRDGALIGIKKSPSYLENVKV